MDGNHSKSAKAEGSLTATPTGGAGTKVGLSDPVVLSGNAIAQRIKATLGITGLSLPRVHIDGVVWHLDVGSSHPGAVVGPAGLGCSPIKAVRELGSERHETVRSLSGRGRRISERSCPWYERTGMDDLAGGPVGLPKPWPVQPSPEGINAEGILSVKPPQDEISHS